VELIVAPESITSSAVRALNYLAVDELNRRYGGDQTGDEEPLADYDVPAGFYLVARDASGHLAGGVAVRSLAHLSSGLCEIKRLWVRPDLRRQKVAARLLLAAEDLARRRGYREIFLETGWAQPEAIALYENEGWTRVEEGPAGAAHYPDSHRFVKPL
jgi:GNAT superfamily N-acetyltransferase